MEKVEASLRSHGQSGMKEEPFRCTLMLHSLLENPPGDFPDPNKEDFVNGFVKIFSLLRFFRVLFYSWFLRCEYFCYAWLNKLSHLFTFSPCSLGTRGRLRGSFSNVWTRTCWETVQILALLPWQSTSPCNNLFSVFGWLRMIRVLRFFVYLIEDCLLFYILGNGVHILF